MRKKKQGPNSDLQGFQRRNNGKLFLVRIHKKFNGKVTTVCLFVLPGKICVEVSVVKVKCEILR